MKGTPTNPIIQAWEREGNRRMVTRKIKVGRKWVRVPLYDTIHKAKKRLVYGNQKFKGCCEVEEI
jgi:hypothetical protein